MYNVIDPLHLRVFSVSNHNCVLKIVFPFLEHVPLKATSEEKARRKNPP